MERAKCAITNPGARWLRTVKPPSTAWLTTPRGRSTPSAARSRRNGRRTKARTPAATAESPTRPESSRLPYSMTAWV
jgi:hypothetical protein